MHDTKERLSLLWIFVVFNYLYADVLAPFDIVGSRNPAAHLTQWALLGSAVLLEIPIAMIIACRLLRFRANRLANMIAGGVETLAETRLKCRVLEPSWSQILNCKEPISGLPVSCLTSFRLNQQFFW
jgi:hypothetical protein